MIFRRKCISLVFIVYTGVNTAATSETQAYYSTPQALEGKALYQQHCAACHGDKLDNGAFASPLVGEVFYGKWGQRSVKDLLLFIEQTMPAGRPGLLSRRQYINILAYLFQAEGIASGSGELPIDEQALAALELPTPKRGLRVEENIALPPDPNPAINPLEQITPVTDALLAKPADKDWLMWRRTYDAHGYSPLAAIDASNVKDMTTQWSWSMPSGRTVATPLVHDGVMFMYGVGDEVHALDAASGDLLWRYEGREQGDSARYALRAISIYGNKLIVPTNDGNVLALDVKTGKVIWDKPVINPVPFRFSGGPLVAAGQILMGTSTGHAPGHNFIVALDAENGEETWRFYTVAREGEQGGDTWNLLSAEQRAGAGVWIPGSFDPATGLAFFGTGNTYNPLPMRTLATGARSNDGLYMDSTLALDAMTGKLVWHFQHLRNDQWNYDEAFERLILKRDINGKNESLVFSGGKLGIFDGLAIEDGGYRFSVDMGLQTVVEHIDSKTGLRKIAAEAFPSETRTQFICPSHRGARTWRPTAFNRDNRLLYIPFGESCMKLRPPPLVSGDIMLGGVGTKAYPKPDSDGYFGGIQAMDIDTGKTVWTTRRRAVPSTGVLATAGNLVFVGSLDRVFAAYHAETGEELWRVRLNDIPSASPITYSVNGKQYIAIITGENSGWVKNMDSFLSPEIKTPRDNNTTIWVFALPETQRSAYFKD